LNGWYREEEGRVIWDVRVVRDDVGGLSALRARRKGRRGMDERGGCDKVFWTQATVEYEQLRLW